VTILTGRRETRLPYPSHHDISTVARALTATPPHTDTVQRAGFGLVKKIKLY